VLRHAEEPVQRSRKDGVFETGYPNEFLREISIVDTPGTNAIIRHHEDLSRGFVPRSDLVLFVTSAERPLTESERGYLELIRDWGKTILLVINKADLLADGEKREEVRSEHTRMTRAGEDLAAIDTEADALRAEISAPGVGPTGST
jgi:GTPase Era involved in 16S rRNA processing